VSEYSTTNYTNTPEIIIPSLMESIAKRSLAAASWNFASNAFQILIALARSILLARLLPVETFGIYAFATSIANLSGVFANFGLDGAMLHRSPETADEDQAAATHFTLKLISTFLWALVMFAVATLAFRGTTRLALFVILGAAVVLHATDTAQLILVRRVIHRRLAVISVLDDLFTTVIAVGLALSGATLWALLATNIVTAVLRVVFLYLWHPVWKPSLNWTPGRIAYFLRFGSRNLLATILLRALDRLDDLWTGFFLGASPLGFYSRAYTFATYPRKIIAYPINAVAGGTYAELKEDRQRLSKAFFRTNAFLVRTGFLLAGLLALMAPEFIRIALGEKWLPMLAAFRLMLIFTLLDPIKLTVADLFVAVGRPDRIVAARTVQLVVMVAGLFFLGLPFGITGVALAVDLMLLVGIALLLFQARGYVDFSLIKLFAVPALALLLALSSTGAIFFFDLFSLNDWLSALLKLVVFTTAYSATLLALEFRQALNMIASLRNSWLDRGP